MTKLGVRPGSGAGRLRAFAVVLAASALAACGGSGDSTPDPGPCADGATRACYTGPAINRGVGACVLGVETCTGGVFGACVGDVLPGSETCNGADDDCDGAPDDGAATTCASGVCAGGACQDPTCNDGVKNGDETGEDCGGPTACPRCGAGEGCAEDGDCDLDVCLAGLCRADLNGCVPAGAADHTQLPAVTVTFPVGFSSAYDKPCIRVTAGTSVTFSGDFTFHPLQGGVVLGTALTPATSGPFATATSSGTSKAFTMAATGRYPYYCATHGLAGMKGVVFVVP